MPIPAVDLDLMRSAPQASDVYLVIQQAQYLSDAPYTGDQEWIGALWYAQIDARPTADPTITLTVDNGMIGNVDLLDGMTVFIGSSLGLWDRAIVRLRGDQTVNGATVTLDIGASSDVVGRVHDGDWVVVLDEFRLWQIPGRVEVSGQVVTWYKDYTILWDDTGADDATRRLATMPPVPVMGPPAVKFVDAPEVNSQFYFDWSDSYATAPGEAVASWSSEGEQDHAGNSWVSAAQTPGWQTTFGISGLRGFRVKLEVNDGNGNATTLPFRRGIRYVFTLRRPGQSQPGDPPDAEPIIEFRINSLSGSFQRGHWTANITVYGDAADYYTIIPGSMVILFTEDWYTADSPYMSPTGVRRTSIGPIHDRENILMVGRIMQSSVRHDPETGEVTFDVQSAAGEASQVEQYSIPIGDDASTTDWIHTPTLTVDRAAWHYLCWHTTLARITDFVWASDDHAIKGADFASGSIYQHLSSFYWERLRAMPLCDKYGRVITEVDAQVQVYGSIETLWTLDGCDWLGSIAARRFEVDRCSATDCGTVSYVEGNIIPYLSRAPGTYDGYRGAVSPMNSLALETQEELNIFTGRLYDALNHEWEAQISLAGNWHYLDIVPQSAVYLDDLDTERGIIAGRMLIRDVVVQHKADVGVVFTSIMTEQEMDSSAPGVTIPIPPKLPIPTRRYPDIPSRPGYPPRVGFPEDDTGRRIIATDKGVFVTDGITATIPVWYGANTGFVTAEDKTVWSIARDPFHWWTSGGSERTLWCLSKTGVWKQENFPNGTWIQQIDHLDFLAERGPNFSVWNGSYLYKGQISMSIEIDGRYVVGYGIDAFDHVPPVTSSLRLSDACVCQDNAILNHIGFYLTAPTSEMGWQSVGFEHHSGAQVVYAQPGKRIYHVAQAERRLYKSVNGGGAWVSVDGPYGFFDIGVESSLSIPYEDGGSVVIWASDTTHRISYDAGASFAAIPGLAGLTIEKVGTASLGRRMFATTVSPDISACRYTINGGTTWTTIPLFPIGIVSKDTWTYWQGDVLHNLLLGGDPDPGQTQLIYYHSIGDASWLDKTGNLVTDFSIAAVYDIDRDSMGSA